MNFREGNESTSEIHEFPYFGRDGETWIFVKEMKALQIFMNFRISVEILKTWISVKEMKALQKFMNFRVSVEILKTWISGKEMKALQKFMNFRISVEMVKREFPWRKWKHFRKSWISVFPSRWWKHEFPSRKWKHYRNSWISVYPLKSWKHEFPGSKWKQNWINRPFSAERLTTYLPETEDKEKVSHFLKKQQPLQSWPTVGCVSCRKETEHQYLCTAAFWLEFCGFNCVQLSARNGHGPVAEGKSGRSNWGAFNEARAKRKREKRMTANRAQQSASNWSPEKRLHGETSMPEMKRQLRSQRVFKRLVDQETQTLLSLPTDKLVVEVTVAPRAVSPDRHDQEDAEMKLVVEVTAPPRRRHPPQPSRDQETVDLGRGFGCQPVRQCGQWSHRAAFWCLSFTGNDSGALRKFFCERLIEAAADVEAWDASGHAGLIVVVVVTFFPAASQYHWINFMHCSIFAKEKTFII